MANITANNGGFLSTKEGLPNLDLRYGPYLSKNAAQSILGQDELICVGLTVGIIQGNKIIEYWWQGGTTIDYLVPKQSGNLVWEIVQND